jgi:spoIIIJ-associated protein
MNEDVPLEEQGEVARQFLVGLLDQFDAGGSDVQIRQVDEDTVELAITGEDLGLLIGPKGATLQAVQELTRTVVQRQTGGHNGRLLVDVAGYREKRKAALERFAQEVAEEVLSTGTQRVLEPMQPADRKIVHDLINTIDGVTTTSEGEEPRRRVVILPSG